MPIAARARPGGEHLLCWSPAVAHAWVQLAGPGRSLLEEVVTPGAMAELAAALLHQAAFLHLSARGATPVGWLRAAGWLVEAVRAARARARPDMLDDDGDGVLEVRDGGPPGRRGGGRLGATRSQRVRLLRGPGRDGAWPATQRRARGAAAR